MRKLQVGDKVKDGIGREGVVVLTDLKGSYPVVCRMMWEGATIDTAIETIVTYTEEGRYHVCSPSYDRDLILKPEPSWSSIPIDAKVLVWRDYDTSEKFCRHFAGVSIEGKPKAWVDGLTSFTSGDVKYPYFVWDDCELYKGEE
jgi:hypothetical protein